MQAKGHSANLDVRRGELQSALSPFLSSRLKLLSLEPLDLRLLLSSVRWNAILRENRNIAAPTVVARM